MSGDLEARLRAELGEARWRDLRPHADRDALFLVDGLDLVEATLAVVRDDRQAVSSWLELGALARPTPAQLARWEEAPDTRFACLIAQPFVLARELSPVRVEGVDP